MDIEVRIRTIQTEIADLREKVAKLEDEKGRLDRLFRQAEEWFRRQNIRDAQRRARVRKAKQRQDAS